MLDAPVPRTRFKRMAHSNQPDLFGQTPWRSETFEAAPAVGKPIYSEKYGLIEPPPPGGHTPDTIRARMRRLIAEARAAETMPWKEREAHSHSVMFPYMAEWLPEEEGERLLRDFRAEMERLRRAA